MKSFIASLTLLCSFALSATGQLLPNPDFGSAENPNSSMLSQLNRYGIRTAVSCLPKYLHITTNSRNVPNGLLQASLNSDNTVEVKVKSNANEIILYNFYRVRVSGLPSQYLLLQLQAFGKGTWKPAFFGYDEQGKCVFYKTFEERVLQADRLAPGVLIHRSEFPEKAAFIVAGAAIRGEALCRGLSCVAVSKEKAAELAVEAEREAAKEQIANGGFENGLTNWVLKCHDGAAGRMEIVSDARSGKKALKLVKTNDAGFLQLTTATPVTVRGGKQYTFRAWYSCQDSRLSSLLLLRLSKSADDQSFLYDAIDRAFGYPSQSMLINSAPGKWVKRVGSHLSSKSREIYPNIIFYGNSASVILDDIEMDDYKKFSRPQPADLTKRTEFQFSEKDVYEILERRCNSEAYLEKKGDISTMILDGKPVKPVIYKTEGYHSDYVYNRYTEFASAGVPFAIKTVVFSKSRNDNPIVLAKNKYDWKELEKLLMYQLRQDPHANIIIAFGLSEPYPGWGFANPNEIWRNKKGEFGYGFGLNCEGFVNDIKDAKIPAYYKIFNVPPRPFPSYSSQLYRESVCKSITDIVSHLMASPLGKAVVGFQITGGHDGQFQYMAFDHSGVAQKAFRKFLKNKYGSLEKINRIWKTAYRSFDEISIPEKIRGETGATPLYTLGVLPDYYDFQQHESNELKHICADAAKKASGKRVITFAYGQPMRYHTNTFNRRKGGIDCFVVPSWYPFRQQGYPVGAMPDNGMGYYNKMWLNEMDLRTWTESAKSELYDMWIGSAVNMPFWQSVQRKFAGVSIASGAAWWYYSMYRYFDRPEIMREIADTMRAVDELRLLKPVKFRSDVCFVRYEYSEYLYPTSFHAFNQVGYPWQMMMLETSGVPVDVHNLEDILERKELQDYKVYIFGAAPFLSAEKRAKIDSLLKNNGKVLIWMYDAGYLDENGKSSKNMKALTGFDITASGNFGRATPLLTDHPLASGVPRFISGGEFLFATLAVRGPSPHASRYQVFSMSNLKPEEILAKYPDGRSAAAVRDFGNWVSIYSAAPASLLPEFVNNIARKYGCYRISDAGQSIHMNGNFISIHGVREADWKLFIPKGVSKVYDAYTKEVFDSTSGIVTLPLKWGETRWLFME